MWSSSFSAPGVGPSPASAGIGLSGPVGDSQPSALTPCGQETCPRTVRPLGPRFARAAAPPGALGAASRETGKRPLGSAAGPGTAGLGTAGHKNCPHFPNGPRPAYASSRTPGKAASQGLSRACPSQASAHSGGQVGPRRHSGRGTGAPCRAGLEPPGRAPLQPHPRPLCPPPASCGSRKTTVANATTFPNIRNSVLHSLEVKSRRSPRANVQAAGRWVPPGGSGENLPGLSRLPFLRRQRPPRGLVLPLPPRLSL